jgi:type IV secretory pathway TrbF-like protein
MVMNSGSSKDMIGSATRMADFGGVEPRTSMWDRNFWRIGGIAGVGYAYGRLGFMVGLIGLGYGFWRDHQLDWYIANRPTQTFIGERDATNNIKPMFGADRPYSPDLADIDTFLRQWIKNARWISPDKVLMGNNVTGAFNSLDDVPKAQLTEYYKINFPNDQADQGISRSIEPLGARLVSPNSNTFTLDWIEYEIQGTQALPPVRRTGNFVIVHRAPMNQEEFNKNPSGLWITHVDSEVFRIPAGLVKP